VIRQIKIVELQRFKSEAEKSGLVFCKSAVLYGYFLNNELVAFTGIILYKNKAVFKNSYVPDIYRGNGYFKKLFNYSIAIVKSLGIKKIEATCTDMSINHYIKNNFKVIKVFKKYKKSYR
jgi:GNAT superfamily N-acetyltransferase